ncbi:MAG TPA: hypothetical protein VM284_02685 [Candidatus Limnocylindria bacterium]|nr:hypothetical protein [Candidatus Limnocylindria bacterium]
MADKTSEARRPVAPNVAAARKRVEAARDGVATELDNLNTSVRAAVDIPAKIKRNPVPTLGAAGGAAFLLLGGPKRVAHSVEKALFPKRHSRPPTVLPRDVEKTLDRLPEEDRDRVRAHLERDFAAYLREEHAKDPPSARTSAWKTYDLLLGIVGAAAARELVKKLFAVPKEVRVDPARETAEVDVSAGKQKAESRSKPR